MSPHSPSSAGQPPTGGAPAPKPSEELTREADARLRASFELAPVGMAHVGLGGEWVAVNHRLCELLGYEREELLASRFQELTHPADLAQDLDQALRLLAGETRSYTMPKRYLRKDGSAAWMRLTGSLVRDSQGAPFYFLAVIDEITGPELERLQEEAARGRRVALALDGAEDAVWDWHVPSGAVHYSARWSEMLGYAGDEIVPHLSAWEQLVHPADLPTVRVLLAAHLRGESPQYRAEHRLRRRDGGWAWILTRGKVVERDGAGNALRVVGTHHDVSERHLAVTALRESEATARRQMAELDAIYRGAPVGLGFLDADLRYVRVNARLAVLNGATPEAHVGRTPTEVTPEIAPYFEPMLRHVVATGEPVRALELRVEAPGEPGAARDWLVSYAPAFDPDGTVVGVTGAVSDVTELKRAEAATRTALAREAQTLAQVHDAVIRTDLDGVITGWNRGAERVFGYAEADIVGAHVATLYFEEDRADVETRILAPLRERGAHTVELRNRRADGQACWIRLSLSVMRDEAGTVHGMIGCSTDVTERVLAERARDALLAAQADHFTTLSHELRTPLTAIGGHAQLLLAGVQGPLGDAQRDGLERIERARRHLTGLIDDVLDLSRVQAGALALTPSAVRLADVVADLEPLIGPQVLLRVRDAGPGIPPAQLEHIFDPFVQLSTEQGGATASGTTGLGLTISRDLMRAMGGTVRARSLAGHGASFTLTLRSAAGGSAAGGSASAEAISRP